MKTLYLDIFSGISGDMFMGAMLDLGVKMDDLTRELEKLRLEGYHLHASRERRFQIEGARFEVNVGHDHDHHHEHGNKHHHDHGHAHAPAHAHEHSDEQGRAYGDIKLLIQESLLSEWVKAKSMAVFERIAVAEGKIHGLPVAEVHFHEVGAIDSIVDIVGACVALEVLGRPRVLWAALWKARDGLIARMAGFRCLRRPRWKSSRRAEFRSRSAMNPENW